MWQIGLKQESRRSLERGATVAPVTNVQRRAVTGQPEPKQTGFAPPPAFKNMPIGRIALR